MDTSAISGSSMLLRSEQTRQVLSTTMIKQAADQQNMMADLLAQNAQNAQNARQAPQPAAKGSNGFSFSTYA